VNVSGRSVLLTGATGGIGHAIARRLHAAGAKLTLTGRRAEVLEPLAAEVGGLALAIDLTDPAQVERLIEQAGGTEVLVSNAALPASGHIHTYSADQIDRALAVNLRVPILLTTELSRRMAEKGEGHVVLISSIAGKSGQPGSAIYSATKFGLRGFGQGARADLRRLGVGLSVLFPGFISDAGMLVDSGVELPRYVGKSTAEDVANAVLRAIERNEGEVDVAPASVRLSTKFAELAPRTAARVSRRMGAERLADEFGEGQATKR
jgi:short-subunit dehydrogenase